MSATPTSSAVTASRTPPTPSLQMAIPLAKASRIATRVTTPVLASVDSAGTMLSAPERTMMMAISVAASENSAVRRAQIASRDVGCSEMRRRTIALFRSCCVIGFAGGPGRDNWFRR